MVDLAVTATCRGNQKKVVRCHIINKGTKWSLCKNFPSKLKSALTSWREGDFFHYFILFAVGFFKIFGGRVCFRWAFEESFFQTLLYFFSFVFSPLMIPEWQSC